MQEESKTEQRKIESALVEESPIPKVVLEPDESAKPDSETKTVPPDLN